MCGATNKFNHQPHKSRISNNMLYSVPGHQDGQPQYRKRQALGDSERPQKRVKGLLDEDCSSENGQNTSDSAGEVRIPERNASPPEDGFRINENFARRFDHNKKREELQRCNRNHAFSLEGFTNSNSGRKVRQ